MLPVWVWLGAHSQAYAHQADSVRLDEFTVTAYPGRQQAISAPASIAVLSARQLAYQPGITMLPAFNTIPGVRMEERSPGSYRLSLRGSLLRSPFGVRNIKTYIDVFPLTDGGGNTYINLLDINLVQRVEVIKGPDGSLFGANSGGVVRMGIMDMPDSLQGSAGVKGGSYGLLQEYAALQHHIGNNTISIKQAWQRSDGYRENSALSRRYFQADDHWQYGPGSTLKVLLFYADLDYETPGGLTLAQWQVNPQAARPPTATLPGAMSQHAGVRNQTLYGGIAHEALLEPGLKQVIALFGSHTHFSNPFITNYEERYESSMGLRAWMELDRPLGSNAFYTWNLGLEAQRTYSDIANYSNNQGQKDTLQSAGRLSATNAFIFTRLALRLGTCWRFEGAISLNDNRYMFSQTGGEGKRVFAPQLMPRAALCYMLMENLGWRLSVSRGYSPPSVAEIRPSNQVINTQLQPESGWNYETGLRWYSRNNRFTWDVSAFYYRLDKAIVRRLDTAGNEYFVNAGGTNQPGVESAASWKIISRENGIIQTLQIQQSYSYSAFRFRDYTDNVQDYSGNRLTGVPQHNAVTGLLMQTAAHISLFVQYQYTSRLPLNDANSTYAGAYHLLQAKLSWTYHLNAITAITISAGADNLLNEQYSLGNDLNAVGARYYNPAPARNYFVGIGISF